MTPRQFPPSRFYGDEAMSKFEIELVSKDGHSVIAEADDEATALNVMDEAIRQYPGSCRRECHLGHNDEQQPL
jgi:hypothetical protein